MADLNMLLFSRIQYSSIVLNSFANRFLMYDNFILKLLRIDYKLGKLNSYTIYKYNNIV